MTIQHAVRMLARKAGVEIGRYNPAQSQEARLLALLRHHHIDTVVDVGANDGGYGRLLLEGRFCGEILSFEPLEHAHRELTRAAASWEPRWHVAPRMALGAEDSEIKINVAGNSTSSSVLAMRALHAQAAPQSQYVAVQHVPMRRLDGVKHRVLEQGKRILLKIDTQGYEMPVLQGATSLLERVRGVQLELSLAPLYEGQALYRDMVEWLSGRGFELWNVIPGFTDQRTGRMLQMDGVFFRAQP